MNRSRFVTDLVTILAKELTLILPREAEELDHLKHTRRYVDQRIDHIVKGIRATAKKEKG